MTKLNGFENYMLTRGLQMYREQLLKEIQEVESQGKNPLYTTDWVDMTVGELTKKINNMTKKSKF